MSTRLAFVTAAVVCILSLACGKADTESAVKTDLGVGNRRVYDTFLAYKQKTDHCQAKGPGRRVIVSGFGLFTGVDYNISGAVVSSFADPRFVGAVINLGGDAAKATPRGPVADGRVRASWHGGIARNRSLTIDGQPYEVCFLTLDVLWDLAGSIIVHEATRFQPDLVIMTGRGGASARWETAAKNQAAGPGFNPDGSLATDNTPQAPYILPRDPGKIIPMTWSNAAIHAATRDLINGMGYTAVAPRTWSADNDYICNNVSYVALSAAQGVPLVLAGGLLSDAVIAAPGARLPAGVKIGFFHFPADADNDPHRVLTWVQVLATAMRTSLDSLAIAPRVPGRARG